MPIVYFGFFLESMRKRLLHLWYIAIFTSYMKKREIGKTFTEKRTHVWSETTAE